MTAQDTQKDKKNSENNLGYKVLREPWITEASTAAMEMNKYVFKISPDATKKQVKSSVESLYKVHVLSVHTISLPGKARNYGKTSGWKSGLRKAIVTLKKGEKIGLFDS